MTARPTDPLDRGAAAHPDRPAIVQRQRSLTYEQARALSCRVAQRLHAAGFQPGQHGAVLAPNDAVSFVVSLGIQRAGLAFIPLNPRDAIPQLGILLDRLDAAVLFVHPAFTAAVEELRAAAPGLREVVAIGDLDAWLGDAPDTDVTVDPNPDRIAAIFPTSGTTGLPRGVMHSVNGLMHAVDALCELMAHPDGPPVYLAAAPLTHVSGRIALSMMNLGATSIVLEKAEPYAILEAVAQHDVTFTMLPPTVIGALLALPDITDWRFPALRYIGYGSAPMRLEIIKRALEVFGPVMSQGYGQTEAPMVITNMSPEEHLVDGRPAGDERLSSVGRPTRFVDLSILDDDLNPLAGGEVGEVCLRGDFLTVGYYRDPEATADVRRGGWHHTGDLGYLDAEGYLHLVDRKKDMIISGGFNVYSAEVERVITDLPGVAEVAVFGVPDERWGEAVRAAVVLRDGATLGAEQVIEHVKRHLGSVKAPKTVDFRRSLPRNPTGKVLKRRLRDELSCV